MPVTRRKFHGALGIAALASSLGDSPGYAAETSPGGVGLRERGCSLDPSVLVFHKPHHDDAVAQIERVARLGFRRAHLVISLFCQLDAQRRVLAYGRVERERFVPLNEGARSDFTDHLRGAFAAVRNAGLATSVTAHLNSWGEHGAWRNLFDFDPRAPCGAYSYEQALIEPIVAAHYDASGDAPWELAVLGEMGCTLIRWPEAYAELIQRLRQDKRATRGKYGVSLNFDDALGGVQPTLEQRRGLNAAFEGCDFLGMSAYRPLTLPLTPDDFAEQVEAFLNQLDHETVTAHRRLPLVLTEVGIGGCVQNDVPAPSPAEAVRTPWIGAASARRTPWNDPALRALRREFHQALLGFLAAPHQAVPPLNVPLVGAYLWSEGSWDPLDIVDRGFFDADIARAIGIHNRQLVP